MTNNGNENGFRELYGRKMRLEKQPYYLQAKRVHGFIALSLLLLIALLKNYERKQQSPSDLPMQVSILQRAPTHGRQRSRFLMLTRTRSDESTSHASTIVGRRNRVEVR